MRNLRSHLASLGEDYSGLNDEDFQQIALLLIDLRNADRRGQVAIRPS